MATNFWPDLSKLAPSRGMREMLHEAAGGLDARTNGEITFYIDTLGVSAVVRQIRHNCYLRLAKTGYNHLLFRVSTPVPGPWPATISTPEGEPYPGIAEEGQLREEVRKILQRDRAREILSYLIGIAR